MRQSKQEEIEALKQELEQLRVQTQGTVQKAERELEELRRRLAQSEEEFAEFKRAKEIEDLLVVKFEIASLDEERLSRQSTLIEDLEQEKASLEARVLQMSQELGLVLADKRSLAEKTRIFQTKCLELEGVLQRAEEESGEAERRLRRELQLQAEKLESQERALREGQQQLE